MPGNVFNMAFIISLIARLGQHVDTLAHIQQLFCTSFLERAPWRCCHLLACLMTCFGKMFMHWPILTHSLTYTFAVHLSDMSSLPSSFPDTKPFLPCGSDSCFVASHQYTRSTALSLVFMTLCLTNVWPHQLLLPLKASRPLTFH